MCVFKYHAFIFFMRPPRWRYGTHTILFSDCLFVTKKVEKSLLEAENLSRMNIEEKSTDKNIIPIKYISKKLKSLENGLLSLTFPVRFSEIFLISEISLKFRIFDIDIDLFWETKLSHSEGSPWNCFIWRDEICTIKAKNKNKNVFIITVLKSQSLSKNAWWISPF